MKCIHKPVSLFISIELTLGQCRGLEALTAPSTVENLHITLYSTLPQSPQFQQYCSV